MNSLIKFYILDSTVRVVISKYFLIGSDIRHALVSSSLEDDVTAKLSWNLDLSI